MNFVFIILNIFLFISNVSCYNYLSKIQWQYIRNILGNKKTPIDIKLKTKKIIYQHYEDWALYKAKQFVNDKKYLCRNIKVNELSIYAVKGLINAIEKYNTDYNSNFSKYAEYYIMNALYDGASDLQPLTIIPKTYRKTNNYLKKNCNKKRYYKALRPIFYGKDYFHLESRQKYTEQINDRMLDDTWIYIDNNFDYYSRRIYHLKYDYDFNVIRSNKEISEILNCSEETVRKNIIKIQSFTHNNFYKNNSTLYF